MLTKQRHLGLKWRSIFWATLIAGVLDITAACTQNYLAGGVTPDGVLAYIASGILGESAYSSDTTVLFLGLLVHFFIIFACVFCFFWLYPKWSFLHRSILANAVLIALIAWVVTTQIIVRLSAIPAGGFQLKNALISIGILIIAVGFPIAYVAKRAYRKQQGR